MVVDKDPRYIDFISPMAKSMPDAYFIVCVRSAAGVVGSKQRTAWSRHRPTWLNALVGAAQIGGLLHTLRVNQELASRVLFVSYEKMIDEPEITLKSIFNEVGEIGGDLDIPPPEAWRAVANQLQSKEEAMWKGRTLHPVGFSSESAERSAAPRHVSRWLGREQDRLLEATNRFGGVVYAMDLAELVRPRWTFSAVLGRSYLAAVHTGLVANLDERRRRWGNERS